MGILRWYQGPQLDKGTFGLQMEYPIGPNVSFLQQVIKLEQTSKKSPSELHAALTPGALKPSTCAWWLESQIIDNQTRSAGRDIWVPRALLPPLNLHPRHRCEPQPAISLDNLVPKGHHDRYSAEHFPEAQESRVQKAHVQAVPVVRSRPDLRCYHASTCMYVVTEGDRGRRALAPLQGCRAPNHDSRERRRAPT